MRPNLFCIVFLCLLSLILSCSDDEEVPLIDIVKEPTGSPEGQAAVPNTDDLMMTDPAPDDEERDPPEPEVVKPDVDPIQDAIDGVLDRMREGYEKEDLDLYLSAFWVDGFRYISDMATPQDRFDDVIFDDLNFEAQSAAHVFENLQNIGLQIFRPAQIINAAPDRIEAMTHYRIQAFANDGHALVGGFLEWFAEGDSRFTFELREENWRITEWLDKAFDPRAIQLLVKDIKPKAGVNPTGKLASTWGEIKIQF